jgi:DME family drug/metabolite transporter
VLIGLAAVSWGTTGSVTAVLVSRAGARPLVIGTVRMVIAAALLVVVALAVAGSLRIDRRDRWRCVALGLCMAAFQATYFSAVTLVGIAVAALIAICGAPLLIAGLAAIVLGERVTARVGGALALGVAGTALLIVGPRTAAGVSTHFVAGVLLALGASLAYALYVVLAKAALARTPPLPLAAATFTVAALVLTSAVAALLVGPALAARVLAPPEVAALVLAPAAGGADILRQLALGWPWMLYLGAVTTAAAYAIYTIGLRAVPASAAGIAALMEPLTATLLGVWLFGERLGAAGVAGAALLFAALGLLVTRDAA